MKKTVKYTILQLITGILMIYGIIYLVNVFQDDKKTVIRYDEMKTQYVSNTTAGMVVEQNLYIDYPNAVGWISLPDFDQGYPIMKGTDNTYYLSHNPDGDSLRSGSIFMECANSGYNDAHVILYGHAMQNGSMFGSLLHYEDQQFYLNNSHEFTIYTPNQKLVYEIFAVERVEPDSLVYTVGFNHDDQFGGFIEMIKADSIYGTNISVDHHDQIVTLSTCSNGGQIRLIVSGKLIEETKL